MKKMRTIAVITLVLTAFMVNASTGVTKNVEKTQEVSKTIVPKVVDENELGSNVTPCDCIGTYINGEEFNASEATQTPGSMVRIVKQCDATKCDRSRCKYSLNGGRVRTGKCQ